MVSPAYVRPLGVSAGSKWEIRGKSNTGVLLILGCGKVGRFAMAEAGDIGWNSGGSFRRKNAAV